MLEDAGFTVEVLSKMRWPQIPLNPSSMALQFRELENEELTIAEAELLISPRS